MEHNVDEKYFVSGDKLPKWEYLKGVKKIQRFKDGSPWTYSEGSISYPDDLDKPARTIVVPLITRMGKVLDEIFENE